MNRYKKPGEFIVSKEKEIQALHDIESILAELGDDSYVSVAFEGCVDIARENIDNDAMDSLRQRYERAAETAAGYRDELDRAHDTIAEMKKPAADELNRNIAGMARVAVSSTGAAQQIVLRAIRDLFAQEDTAAAADYTNAC